LICKSCAGEGVKIINGKQRPSDCTGCVAESLIRQKDHPMGIMSYEHAAKLCSCLANNHEGEIKINTSEEFDKVVQEHKRQYEARQKEKSVRVFYHDKQRQEAKEYYQKRKIELKKLDENGPEWILNEEIIKDE